MYICNVNNNFKTKTMSSTTLSSKQKKLAELLQSQDGYKLLKQKDASVIILVKGKTRIKIK